MRMDKRMRFGKSKQLVFRPYTSTGMVGIGIGYRIGDTIVTLFDGFVNGTGGEIAHHVRKSFGRIPVNRIRIITAGIG
ncbi:hypothetical protein D3C87_1164680 [compost metagenome]